MATTTASGEAAARRPLREETLSREEVGGGRLSVGHCEGKRRTLASPASERNPSDWFQ